MRIKDIARVCHESNRAYCERLGDFSQRPWGEAEQWQRDSSIKGVQFFIDNPFAGSEEIHNSWLKEKVNNGWIFGKAKDSTKKTHPCIVSFQELPLEQQTKDFLFRAVCKSLISLLEN